MSVKPVQCLPKSQSKDRKMELLKNDIRYIIENKIPACEIVDIPCKSSSMRTLLERAIAIVRWEYMQTESPANLPMFNMFKVSKRTMNGKEHWFVRFDVKAWEKRKEGQNG